MVHEVPYGSTSLIFNDSSNIIQLVIFVNRNLYEILYDIHKKGRLIEKIAEMKRIKTVIVGDCGSGKTMLVQAMTQSDFKINLPYVATVSDNIALALHFNGVDTEVGIWDTAGSVIKTNKYICQNYV